MPPISLGTIIEVLIFDKYDKCELLYNASPELYEVFIEMVKQFCNPSSHHNLVSFLPAMLKYCLRAVLLAGANPQPSFSAFDELIPSLQLYIMSGKAYIPSLLELFEFGAKANAIAYGGDYPAMFYALWKFWNDDVGEEYVEILLKHGAGSNLPCPFNFCPVEKVQPSHRLIDIGYFMGLLPLDCMIISLIEQQYFHLVKDPYPDKYDRIDLIITSQKIIDLLVSYDAKASSKKVLELALKDAVDLLGKKYKKPATTQLNNLIDYFVNKYAPPNRRKNGIKASPHRFTLESDLY